MTFNPSDYAYKIRIDTSLARTNSLISGDHTNLYWAFPASYLLAPIQAEGLAPSILVAAELRASSDSAGATEIPIYVSPSFAVVDSPASISGIIYFKADLRASATDEIYLWFDGPGSSAYAATDPYGRNNVFDSTATSFWGHDEDPGSSAPQFADWAGGGRAGTATNIGSADGVTGQSGRAIHINASGEGANIGDLAGAIGANDFTLFALSRYLTGSTADGALIGSTGSANLRINYAATATRFRFYTNGSIRAFNLSTGQQSALSSWFTASWSRSGSNLTGYINGGLISTINTGAFTLLSDTNTWGASTGTQSTYIDDSFVLIGSTLSQQAIAALTNMYLSPASFWDVGDVELSELERSIQVSLPAGETGFKLAAYKASDGSLIDEISSSSNEIEALTYSVLAPYNIRFVALKPGWRPVEAVLNATTAGLQVVADVFQRDYVYAASGLTENTHFSVDVALSEIEILQSGIPLKTLYSATIESFYNTTGRLAYPIPMRVNLFNSTNALGFEFWNGWDFADQTSIDNVQANGGITRYTGAGTGLSKVWIGIDTLNDIGSVQLYYRDSTGGAATLFPHSGRVRSLIKVFDSGLSLDNRNYDFELFQREFGLVYDYLRIGDIYDLPLAGQLYSLPITAVNDPSIDASEAATVAGWTDIAIAGSTTFDFDGDSTAEPYDLAVDGAGRSAAQVAKRLQYLTARGQTGLIDGVQGQLYLQADNSYAVQKEGPLARIVGGRVQGARGVLIGGTSDPTTLDLIDSDGVSRLAPDIEIYLRQVTGLPTGAKVLLARRSANNLVLTNEFTLAAGNNSGNGTLVVSEPIPADKPSTGYVRVVDPSDDTEQRYAYTSWSGSTFTLSGTLSRSYSTGTGCYAPYLDLTAASDSASVSLQHVSDRAVLLRVRLGSGSGAIKDITQNFTLTNQDASVPVSGIEDAINNR